MKRFIKNFRFELIALFIVVVAELCVFNHLGLQKIKDSQINNLFQKNFMTFDVGQKYIVRYKHDLFYDMKPEFVQVGDSSGFYSIRPNIVKKYLGGKDYVDLNCCGDTGWDGYGYIANDYLRNDPKAEYLVLYITPYSLPMQHKLGFSKELKAIFADNKENPFRFVNFIPSLYYRPEVLNVVYSEESEVQDTEYMRVMNNLGIDKAVVRKSNMTLVDFLKDSRGWAPYGEKEKLKKLMPLGECGPHMLERFYTEDKKPTFFNALEKVKKVADANKVKLVVLINPVACKDSAMVDPIRDDLAMFRKKYPDVYIPFDLITTWKAEDFSDEWHLTPEASVRNSERVGKALNYLLTYGKYLPKKK